MLTIGLEIHINVINLLQFELKSYTFGLKINSNITKSNTFGLENNLNMLEIVTISLNILTTHRCKSAVPYKSKKRSSLWDCNTNGTHAKLNQVEIVGISRLWFNS